MDIWKHGKYIDMWSAVHFLSGFLLVAIFYQMEFRLTSALVFSTLLLILWETFEWLIKIIEPSVNVIMDIVVGLGGFAFGAILFYFLNQPFENYFYITAIGTLFLAVWGFLDFLKRGYR